MSEKIEVQASLEEQGLAQVAWQIYWQSMNPHVDEFDQALSEKALQYLHEIFDRKLARKH